VASRPVPVCPEHGPKTLYRNGKGRTTYRCTPCRTTYNRANGYFPERRERVYPTPARVCAEGHDLTPYGPKPIYRCLTCKRERDAANRLTKIARDREQRKLDARKKMVRTAIIKELSRRQGSVYIPHSNAQNLEEAMRPIRFPGEAV
jgi:DNA-directed RNA polymerase subunit RPC12/RpoP